MILTKKEFVKVLGSRESQLANNMTPTITNTEKLNHKQIAIKEILEKKCPYMIKRLIPYNNQYELIDINKLHIPDHLIKMIDATS